MFLFNLLLASLSLLSVTIIFLTISKKPDRGHKLSDVHIKRIDNVDKIIFILIILYVLNCSLLYKLQ